MKILVVDDDPVSRLLLQASLAAAGHRVQEAPDGASAWELMQRESFRLVITDWLMPGVDGIELIRRIRASQTNGYVYIILLTIRGSKDDIVSGIEAGADDYLTKPFNPSELRARVGIGERILNLEARLTEARDQMERLASHDSLTGLLNRRAVHQAAEAEIQRALRSHKPLSLLLLDVDRLKTINDRFGQHTGDKALQLIAETLQRFKRSYDLIGRWSGEEFLIILPETSAADLGSIAARLHEQIAATAIEIDDGQPFPLNVQFGGVALDLNQPQALDALIQRADEALSDAKRRGAAIQLADLPQARVTRE